MNTSTETTTSTNSETVEETPISVAEFYAWNEMCDEFSSRMFQDFESTFRDKYSRAEGKKSATIDPREAYQFILTWCARTTSYEQNKTRELQKFLEYAKKRGEVLN